jgi:DNA-binding protein HU-beta
VGIIAHRPVVLWRPKCVGLTPQFCGCYKACSYDQITIRGYDVNKAELIDAIAIEADLSKAAAGRALDAAVAAVQQALKKGDTVTLVGFGTFYLGTRAARNGRNPQTGETIKIKSAKVPKFRAGKALKDSVN